MEIIRRKTNRPLYIIYANVDDTIKCTSPELLNLSVFRSLYMDLTKQVIRPIKGGEWFEHINACLKEATEIEETLDESPAILLRSWIIETAEANQDKITRLEDGAVVIDGIVHVTHKAASEHMNTTIYRSAKWDDIKCMLAAIGFAYDRTIPQIRHGKKRSRTYRMKYDLLLALSNE